MSEGITRINSSTNVLEHSEIVLMREKIEVNLNGEFDSGRFFFAFCVYSAAFL